MFEAPSEIRSAAAPAGDVAVGLAPFAGLDVRRLWSAVWRGKGTILATAATSLLIALSLVLVLPHRYTGR